MGLPPIELKRELEELFELSTVASLATCLAFCSSNCGPVVAVWIGFSDVGAASCNACGDASADFSTNDPAVALSSMSVVAVNRRAYTQDTGAIGGATRMLVGAFTDGERTAGDILMNL